MTMTREEYLEFVLDEHVKTLGKEHVNAETGTTVVFSGFYGYAYYTRNAEGTWDRAIK